MISHMQADKCDANRALLRAVLLKVTHQGQHKCDSTGAKSDVRDCLVNVA